MVRGPRATHYSIVRICNSGAPSGHRAISSSVAVVGGGLAGSEAAYQLAEHGFDVVLHEMRPVKATPAHKTDRLAELVCSNTFKSTELTNAHGLLKAEMRAMGSIILQASNELHGLRNVGDTNATYHVILWRSAATPPKDPAP